MVQRSNRSARIVKNSDTEVEESEREDVGSEVGEDEQSTEEDVGKAYARIQADRVAEGCNKKVCGHYAPLFSASTHF